MRDESDAVLLGHPRDAAFFADAADPGNVRLHDVEGSLLKPGNERLSAGQDLAPGDRHRRTVPQQYVIVQVVRWKRLLEPRDVEIGEHAGGARRPLVVLRPKGVACARVDHQQTLRSNGVARGANDCLVHGEAMLTKRRLAQRRPPKRSPTNLERAKALTTNRGELLRKGLRFAHQQRGVGLHSLAVAPAQEPADRLAGYLAEDVPQGDVDSTDGVRDGAAASHPERVRMQLLDRK